MPWSISILDCERALWSTASRGTIPAPSLQGLPSGVQPIHLLTPRFGRAILDQPSAHEELRHAFTRLPDHLDRPACIQG